MGFGLVSPVFQSGCIIIFLHQYLKASYWKKYSLIHAVNHCVGKVEIVYGYVSMVAPIYVHTQCVFLQGVVSECRYEVTFPVSY